MNIETDNSQNDDVENDEVIGQAFKGSLIVLAVIALGVTGIVAVRAWLQPVAKVEQKTEIELPKQREIAEQQLPQIPLRDVTGTCGVDWVHVSGMEGEKLLPETMGGGVTIFDFDRDGDQDLLFVGGTTWPWAEKPNPNPRSLCLFANDGTGKFTDVTAQAGLESNLYCMGAAAADIDNDGWSDLFVTCVGENHFFRNQQGQFTDATDSAGLRGKPQGWSAGATWFDYDKDGLLDLFVTDYVVWSRELDRSLGFQLTGVGRAYGQPTSFTGTHSSLYHNVGEGKFEDVSEAMGIPVINENTGVPEGKGLGVAAVDVDQDGWQDIVVANDTIRNFLFLNQQGKGFEEAGRPMGLAYDRSGNATGAMGLDCAFFRNDESLAIAIGNFANEQSSLYVARDPGVPFNDLAMVTGLGPQSRLNLTFGMVFVDLDLDGRQDLVCANGHLEEEISKVQVTQQYAQPPQFFWNAGTTGASEFVALQAEQVGEAALQRMVGRGTAVADLDADGDLDVVLVANSGPPRILLNEQQLGHHWIQLNLEAKNSNRDAVGALVLVKYQTADGTITQRRLVTTTNSYLSQSEMQLTFGMGENATPVQVEVHWPSGAVEAGELPVDQRHHLVEGEAF